RDDLHVPLLAQLTRDRSEDTRRPRLAVVIDDHDRILIELDVAAVLATRLLDRAHDDRLRHVRLLDRAIGQRVLDGYHHLISESRIPTTRASEHADHQRLLGTGIIRDLYHRFLLDHGSVPQRARSTISTIRHRLSFDKGRISMMRTVSPVLASLASSCAFNRVVR